MNDTAWKSRIVFLLGVVSGMGLMWVVGDIAWKSRIVEQGYAHYETKSGKWTWGAP